MTKSAATADVQSCSHHYHVAHNHHPAALTATDQKLADTLRLHITAILTTILVLAVLS